MRLQTIQSEKEKRIKIYISEFKEFYYEGQILSENDIYNNFLGHVIINKFIIHKRKNKEKYLCVNLNSLIYKTKNWTLNIECLGENYRI